MIGNDEEGKRPPERLPFIFLEDEEVINSLIVLIGGSYGHGIKLVDTTACRNINHIIYVSTNGEEKVIFEVVWC